MTINQDQLDSLVRTAAKMAGAILTAHGLNSMATAINSSDTISVATGAVLALLAMWSSHKSNSITITKP